MAMIGKVRRMFFREKKSEREIARLTSLSRNTIRSWLRAPVEGEPKYRRAGGPCKLTPFHDAIKQALKADALRPRSERRTALALFGQVKADGYDGGYSRVTDFIRDWRQREGQAAARASFVPLAFAWGEAFQFDWSEEGLIVGGVHYRAQGGAHEAVRQPRVLAGGLIPARATRCCSTPIRAASLRSAGSPIAASTTT